MSQKKLSTEFWGRCWETSFLDLFGPSKLSGTVWVNLGDFAPKIWSPSIALQILLATFFGTPSSVVQSYSKKVHVAKSSLLRIVFVPHFCGTLNVFQPQKGAGCNKLWKVAENYKLPQIRGGWLAGNSIKPLKELNISLAWALHFFSQKKRKKKLKHENSNRYQQDSIILSFFSSFWMPLCILTITINSIIPMIAIFIIYHPYHQCIPLSWLLSLSSFITSRKSRVRRENWRKSVPLFRM